MVGRPRCVECDAPITYPSEAPCDRCRRAWRWLADEQDEQLLEAWEAVRAQILETVPGALAVVNIRIVSWQNRVLTLSGFLRDRRWFARRYLELTQHFIRTEKEVVLLTPRAGATIARKIKRDKERA